MEATPAPLPLDVLRYRKDREAELKEANERWLENNTEVSHVLNDFMCALLADQPNDIFTYARSHFSPPDASADQKGEPGDPADASSTKAGEDASSVEPGALDTTSQDGEEAEREAED
eukprot:scaffold66028_cov33-Tisochrysis_lutea.AAC.1